MNLETILQQSAQITINSGVTVTRSAKYSTVSIDDSEGNNVFLQGDDADQFNDACAQVWNDVGTLGMDIVELALAEPYLHLLGGN